jgi:hypothetical protein
MNELQQQDYLLFLKILPKQPNYHTLLFLEINLLPYRDRLYTHINLHIITWLLSFSNINHIVQPLYIHKPTIFFHALYTNHTLLIKLLLAHKPIHHTHNSYSLLTALYTKHLPTIKSLIPHTNIHFPIQNTTPYLYAITHFTSKHPINLLFTYLNFHNHSLKQLIHHTTLPIHSLRHIKSFLI